MASSAVQVVASASGRVVVVSLVGEHDLANAENLRRTLLDLSSRVPLIVLDFDRTSFVDSSVLGVFAGACKRAARNGSSVIGVNARGIVLRALSMTGLDGLLDLAPPPGELERELAALLDPREGRGDTAL
jgi:anti-anti-sigma factor